MRAMIKGYGPEFKYNSPGELLAAAVATPEDIARLMEPFPARGRYRKSTDFLTQVTSGYALGRKRYRLFALRLISLACLMEKYQGVHRDKKIIPGLTPDDEKKLLALGDDINCDILAEILESVAEHDTAAYADAFKILIYCYLPHLAPYIEAVHFMDTSEDNWGNVIGLTLSELVFGHVVSAYIGFCESVLDYVDRYKNTRIWEIPETEDENSIFLLPAFTHQQSSTNSTCTKKFVTPVKQVVQLLLEMTDGNVFKPFAGKFGGITGNYDSHFAAYPDINWFAHGKEYVESLGLYYESIVNQSVSFTREAQHFRTLRTINEQIVKFNLDFRFLVSCPGQFFVKKLRVGRKGSSSNPGKTNLWMFEGAEMLLRKANALLEFNATALQGYTQEGHMGRSVLMRDIGTDFSSIFIALSRMQTELKGCVPNVEKIRRFIEEYPSLSMSAMQYVLKRERFQGDAYREMQSMVMNPDGSYATRAEFMPRFETFLAESGFSPELCAELRSCMNPTQLVRPIEKQATAEIITLRNDISRLRQIQGNTPSLKWYFERQQTI